MLYEYAYKYRVALVVLVTTLSVGFWYGIFTNYQVQTFDSGNQSDSLSGSDYNKTAINSDRGPNVVAPYYVGFETLTKYGMTNDDLLYTKDFLTNYVLYEKQIAYGKISYVDGSVKGPKIDGVNTSYEFGIGVNGSKDATVTVSSDFITQAKTISIKPLSSDKAISRDFAAPSTVGQSEEDN